MSSKREKTFILYIYDDTLEFLHEYKNKCDTKLLKKELLLLKSELKKNKNVRFLHKKRQVNSIIKRNEHSPFSHTIAIGNNGKKTAEYIHEKTGWFPEVYTIPVKREEVAVNRYAFTSRSQFKLLYNLKKQKIDSLAIIDDTLYSGFTFQTILKKLNLNKIDRAHAFCLQAIHESKVELEKMIPVTAGFHMKGKIEKDVSIIRFSGLFERGSIWRGKKKPLAFYHRPRWMKKWFPLNAQTVVSSCISLAHMMEQFASPPNQMSTITYISAL